MDKKKLEELYKQKQQEMEAQRKKLGDLYTRRAEDEKPLTDAELLRQNEMCGSISLEVEHLKRMLARADRPQTAAKPKKAKPKQAKE